MSFTPACGVLIASPGRFAAAARKAGSTSRLTEAGAGANWRTACQKCLAASGFAWPRAIRTSFMPSSKRRTAPFIAQTIGVKHGRWFPNSRISFPAAFTTLASASIQITRTTFTPSPRRFSLQLTAAKRFARSRDARTSTITRSGLIRKIRGACGPVRTGALPSRTTAAKPGKRSITIPSGSFITSMPTTDSRSIE